MLAYLSFEWTVCLHKSFGTFSAQRRAHGEFGDRKEMLFVCIVIADYFFTYRAERGYKKSGKVLENFGFQSSESREKAKVTFPSLIFNEISLP